MIAPAPIKEQLVDMERYITRAWIRWFGNTEAVVNTAISDTVRITSADSPYTIGTTGINLVCDTDGGAISVTFPAGRQSAAVRVCNVGDSGNNVTVTGNGGALISGSASQTLYDREVLETRFDSVEGWN